MAVVDRGTVVEQECLMWEHSSNHRFCAAFNQAAKYIRVSNAAGQQCKFSNDGFVCITICTGHTACIALHGIVWPGMAW